MKTLQERVKAQDPKLTIKQLDKLSRSRDFRVRMAVAKHPNTSELALFNLVNDKTVSVYKVLAPRINAIIASKKEIVAQCMRDGLLDVSISNPANISVYNYVQEDLSPEMSTVNTMVLREGCPDYTSDCDDLCEQPVKTQESTPTAKSDISEPFPRFAAYIMLTALAMVLFDVIIRSL